MKRLLLVLCFLLGAAPALAQVEPFTFRPITGFKLTGLTTVSDVTSHTNKAFDAQTRYVRAVCTASCLVAFQIIPLSGINNAALSVPVFLPGNVPEYFIVPANGMVRVRASTATGDLYITEMGR
jgi:hypothetical protein